MRSPLRHLGIRGRLALLVIAGAIPFVVYAVVRARARSDEARAGTHDRALDVARRIGSRVTVRLSALDEELDLLGGILSPDIRDSTRNVAILERAVTAIQGLDLVLFVGDSAGRIVGRSNWRRDVGAVDIADRDYYITARRTRRRALGGAVMLRPENRYLGVVVAHPILDRDRFRGVVGASLRVRSFQPYMDAAGLPQGSVIALRDSGTVIARSIDADRFVGTNSLDNGTTREQIAQGDGITETVWLDGMTRLTGFTTIPGTRWQVSVGIPSEAAFAPARRALAYELLIVMMTLAAGVFAALYIGSGLVGPIRQLTSDALVVAAGDETHRAGVVSGGEIGVLARTFNTMAARIADRTDALRESEYRARVLFEQNPAAVVLYDSESGVFLDANEMALQLYGYPRQEFIGMHVSEILALDVLPLDERSLPPAGAPPRHIAGRRNRTRTGETRDIDLFVSRTVMHGRTVAIAVCIDITDRLAAQRALAESHEQLRQAQKMEAIGRLAGGIAHDFNNLLTGIIGHSDIAIEMLPAGHPSRDEILSARAASMRAATLTQHLLAFSRRQAVPKSAIDVTAAVRGLDHTLRRLVDDRITMQLRLGTVGSTVTAAESQIEQVLLNLVVNARDAMPNGGTLTVETADETLTPAAASALGIGEGEYVRLSVVDTGVGMDERTRARIFEPFFTTKEQGSGTGLGLATVYGIVQETGGAIRVTSAPGAGSRFDVLLPRLRTGATPVSSQAQDQPSAPPPRGHETVLLAEDEKIVRTLVQVTLSRLGYRVLSAGSGEEALELFALHGHEVNLLLSDVVMPGITGRELAERVTHIRPAVRVLVMSGYHEDAVLREGVEQARIAFLAKPFTPAALAFRVRAVLDAGS